MTPDEVRKRLAVVLEAAPAVTEIVPCPTCGVGEVKRTRKGLTQADVAAAIGVPRTSIVTFLNGQQGLKIAATLRLLDWLSEQEARTP